MNHCSVARKMMGLWQRQQLGYECSIFSKPSSTPRLFSNSTISGLALKTCWPLSYSGRPFFSRSGVVHITMQIDSIFHAGIEVVGAVSRSGMHGARALDP